MPKPWGGMCGMSGGFTPKLHVVVPLDCGPALLSRTACTSWLFHWLARNTPPSGACAGLIPCDHVRVCVCVCVWVPCTFLCKGLDPWCPSEKSAMSVRRHTKVLTDGQG